MSALFRWVVYDIALSITQAVISMMDQKSWPAPAADAHKPLIYMNEKDWKKDGLNPVFPLAGLTLLIRSHPVRPAERPPGATAMCTRGCVDACVCVCVCSRGCTRGGLVFAWVYAWWSRGPPECYSITKGQRLERRQTIGPKRVTSWSPHGHLVVTSWSPRAPSWSPRAPSWSP